VTDFVKTKERPLVRGLGLFDATAIVVGSMIGSGIFITSAESMRLLSAPGWLLMAWIVAGLMTLMGALCCAELATMMPRAGGVYVFLREAYGPALGFLFGWTLFLVVQTGTIAAVAIAFARFLGVFLPPVSGEHYLISPMSLGRSYALSLSTEQLTAIVLIGVLTFVNCLGLKLGKLLQNGFTLAKTIALAGVILAGLWYGCRHSLGTSSGWWNPWQNGWNVESVQPGLGLVGTVAFVVIFGKAMIGPVFAQTAWTNVTFLGSEVRDPGRNLARALLGGCAIVVVLYVLANLAYVLVLPVGGIAHAPENRVAVAMMQKIFGYPGALAMAGAIIVSTFGCDNGLIMAGARVYFAMARDGLFFQRLAGTNRFQVPAAALVAQGVWTALLTLPRTVSINQASGKIAYGNVYTQLLEYIVSADLLFYILLVAAVVVLRRARPDVSRPFATFGYPWVALLAAILAFALMADLAWLAPTTSGIGIAIVLTGIPAYWIWRRRSVTAGVSPATL
jgi:APA family basic amino acid/polyamine antiporter